MADVLLCHPIYLSRSCPRIPKTSQTTHISQNQLQRDLQRCKEVSLLVLSSRLHLPASLATETKTSQPENSPSVSVDCAFHVACSGLVSALTLAFAVPVAPNCTARWVEPFLRLSAFSSVQYRQFLNAWLSRSIMGLNIAGIHLPRIVYLPLCSG